MIEIYNLQVKRVHEGRKWPFDRSYLLKHGTHECLKDLFRYALVLPIEGDLKAMLKAVLIDEYIHIPFDRDDAASEPTKFSAAAWTKFLGKTNWVLGVPLLPKFMKRALPRYLVAAGWYTQNKERDASRVPFPSMSFLQTPEKNIRPVCVACSRFILHENGECHLGQRICYESLALGLTDHYAEGLATREPSANVREQEVEEITHDDIR